MRARHMSLLLAAVASAFSARAAAQSPAPFVQETEEMSVASQDGLMCAAFDGESFWLLGSGWGERVSVSTRTHDGSSVQGETFVNTCNAAALRIGSGVYVATTSLAQRGTISRWFSAAGNGTLLGDHFERYERWFYTAEEMIASGERIYWGSRGEGYRTGKINCLDPVTGAACRSSSIPRFMALVEHEGMPVALTADKVGYALSPSAPPRNLGKLRIPLGRRESRLPEDRPVPLGQGRFLTIDTAAGNEWGERGVWRLLDGDGSTLREQPVRHSWGPRSTRLFVHQGRVYVVSKDPKEEGKVRIGYATVQI